LRLRPVDMAKIGELVLNQGKWQGRQLVSADWIHQMTTPKVASDFGYYWWVNNVVKSEPEVDTMGFKGQFITVLPNEHAVVVMTSMLPVTMDLRDSPYINLYRRMVNGYILPALHPATKPVPSALQTAALRAELKLSQTSHAAPGAPVAFNDTPEL
jgi:CubicO group peptidase (beta-lactamase class C family)